MTAFTVTQRKDTYYLAGFVNEAANFEALKPAPDQPLRLNFQGIIGFSSLGTGNFIRFLKARKDEPTEFHECPRLLVEMINVMPHMLGGKKYASRVTSLYVPCHCKTCNMPMDVLVKGRDVKYVDAEIQLPPLKCHQCRAALEPTVDPLEYFLFIYG